MKLLMALPDWYGVEYKINPWMDLDNPPRKSEALKQWNNLYSILKKLYPVEVLPYGKSMPDTVFTANAGFFPTSGHIIISNFKHKERQPEEDFFYSWFYRRGYTATRIPKNYSFEGEGDLLKCDNKFYGGYGFRSDKDVYKLISDIVKIDISVLELVDPRWYHLDTALYFLDNKTAVFYPGAFSEESKKSIRDTFSTIEVITKEALNFACNSIVINDTVIMPIRCPVLKSKLESLGKTVYEVNTSEFIKAGGSCKCLALWSY